MVHILHISVHYIFTFFYFYDVNSISNTYLGRGEGVVVVVMGGCMREAIRRKGMRETK